jgi:chromosome segregation ATPase
VGTVPCLIQFAFDNEFSWMREKVVSYKITVTPPSKDSLGAGRRRRAQACLKAVDDDLKTAVTRLDAATTQKISLEGEVAKLMQELAEKKKSWQVAEKEEAWLKERKALRMEQLKLLGERLENGWEDEKELNGKK